MSGAIHRLGTDGELDAVFLAALTGVIANPGFFGAVMQGSPVAAVEFASEVVAAITHQSGGAQSLDLDDFLATAELF